MAFRVIDCFNAIQHELFGKPSKELSPIQLINEAGEQLVNMHGWRWLLRAPASLDTVAGQDWVALPSDIGTIITVETTNGLSGTFSPSTLEEILAYRTQSPNTQHFSRFFAVSYYLPTSGVPTPRLEIYPAAQTTQTGAYTLWYSASWVEVSQDTNAIPIPPWMRPLFVQILRATVAGYELSGDGTVDKRLEVVRNGITFASAVDRDKIIQPAFGSLIDNSYSRNWWQDQAVLDP